MRRATVDLIEKMIESKKTVDEAKRSLHNLVSLLLTQQRKTGGTEVVEQGGTAVSSDAIFKN